MHDGDNTNRQHVVVLVNSMVSFDDVKRIVQKKNISRSIHIFLAFGVCPLIADAAASETADAISAYDYDLCITAQRMLLNSDGDEVDIVINRAEIGSGFGTLQMDVDAAADAVIISRSGIFSSLPRPSVVSIVTKP